MPLAITLQLSLQTNKLHHNQLPQQFLIPMCAARFAQSHPATQERLHPILLHKCSRPPAALNNPLPLHNTIQQADRRRSAVLQLVMFVWKFVNQINDVDVLIWHIMYMLGASWEVWRANGLRIASTRMSNLILTKRDVNLPSKVRCWTV